MNSLFVTAALFFQLWMPIWEARPFVVSDFTYKSRTVMDEKMLTPISETLKYADARLRGELYVALAAAPIRGNQQFLLEKCLPAEKDELLRATILRQLARMEPQSIPAEAIAPYLKDASAHVVLAAIQLYGILPDADPRQLVGFLGTPDGKGGQELLSLKLAAWRCFAESPRLANTLGSNFLTFKEVSPLELRCLVLKTALAQQKRKPETTAWLKELLQGPTAMRVVAASDATPADFAIVAKYLQDKDPAVRQAVCEAAKQPGFAAVLPAALGDREPAVRVAALNALNRCCDATKDELLRKVLALFTDSSLLVQDAAEETFVHLAGKNDGALALLETALAPNGGPDAHRHAANAARLLKGYRLAPAIALLLKGEKLPNAIAAELDAIAHLAKYGEFEADVMPFARHPSHLVRKMAVRAIGRLRFKGQEAEVIRLAKDRTATDVCIEAYEAMGRFPQPVFIPTIMSCLKAPGKTLAEERASALWALGYIKPVTQEDKVRFAEAVERLRIHATVAIVPTDVGPTHEQEFVIANAMYSLGKIAKRQETPEEQRNHANYVISLYDVSPEKELELQQQALAAGKGGPGELPRSAVTWSLAQQLRQWMDSKPIETQPIPDATLSFPVKGL
ncbi:MAG: HEAT repeat domain-containing protein [Victivallales bacterium]|nr:HEAT repeat domain-containing protein [Victivallales bacterium]